jgi:folate-dependent phosphoribosylglycinamide formyltransferase PurN
MAIPPRFVVLTSANVEAGMVIEYLVRTTGVTVERIYLDTLADQPTKGRARHRAKSSDRPSRWRRIGWHLRLARRLPRYYAWRALEKVTGLPQLSLLRLCEKLSPYLFRKACGVAFDPGLVAHGRLMHTLEEAAAKNQIPLTVTANINSEDTVQSLTELRPDVIIGLGTRILSEAIIGTASLGVLNGHSSLLPAYRGSTTEFWQLVGGESVTGVTIHWMAARVDQGPICAQRRWPIPRGADHYLLRLMSLFYRLETWAEVIRGLQSGTLESRQQGPSPTPTFRRPTVRQEYDYYCKGVCPIVMTTEQAVTSPSLTRQRDRPRAGKP